MNLLHRYPAVVTRSPTAAATDAARFADRVEAYDAFTAPRRYRVTVHSVPLDGLRLDALRTTGHRATFVDEAHLGILVAARGTLAVDDGRGAREVRGDAGAVWRPGRRTTTIRGPYTGLGLRVPLAAIAAHAARNPEDRWRADGPFPACPQPRLVRLLRHVVAELDAPEELSPASAVGRGLARLMLDLLMEDFARVAPPAPRPATTAGLAVVRRAEAVLRARLQDAVSIVALAGELGTSTRALQEGFRRHRGMTPRAFLARCRLEAAHERLAAARPGETVSSIAFDCGIMHLGRFAAAYRRRYGEAPSATLARTRDRR